MTYHPNDRRQIHIPIEDIKERYVQAPAGLALEEQRKVLAESFGLASEHTVLLGETFERLAAVYHDAEAVLEATDNDNLQKQDLLYSICEQYFSLLAVLSWKKRRQIKSDKLTRKMKKCLKRSAPKSSTVQFWIKYCLYAVPLFIIFLIFEIWFLDLLGTDAPLWQTLFAFLGFGAGFAGYCVVCYHIEGQRLFGDLQSWIRYLQNPLGHNRPISLFQVLKLALPPLATIVSALIKIYFDSN